MLKDELTLFLLNNKLEIKTEIDDKLTWKSTIDLKCLVCGHTLSITVKQLLRPHPERVGFVCPRCESERKFINKLSEKYGRVPYDFLTQFTGYKDNIKVKCKDCGEEWECNAESLLMNSKLKGNNHPCKNCTRLREISGKDISELKNALINKFGTCNYEFPNPGQYAGMFSKKKIDIICKLCGHEMSTSVYNILNPKNGKHYCRVCNKKDRLLETIDYKTRCLKSTNGKIEPIEDYIDSKTKIKHKCNICGYGSNGEWLKIPVKNTSKNAGCPICTKRIPVSKAETEIYEFISELYSGEIQKNVRDILSKKEIDIYLPELKIGFEIDGLYWHSEKYKGKKYHLEKTMEAHKLGIRLIHIFEDEWYHKKEICKDKIANIIGLSKNKRIFARNCEIVDNISPKDKNEFLDQYHIQGADKATIISALKYNNEVVAVMTFAKPRVSLGRKSGADGEYELSRFACSYNVVGGFSRLLKHSINKYNISIINTYADLRWSSMDKNVYITNGFTEIKKSAPNYWYFDKNLSSESTKRIHRYNFRKQLLKDKFPEIYNDSLTEFEIMDKTNYDRIWDCGNIVYQWKRKDN